MKITTGYFADNLTVDEAIARVEEGGSINVYGFNSMEEAKEIAAKFPKFVGVKAVRCNGSNFERYGIATIDGNHAPSLFLNISEKNRVTGTANEGGNRRLVAFAKVLRSLELA